MNIAATPTEAQLRVELAAAYRIAALEGLDDGLFNHFSCAVPGSPGHFLLKPFGPLFEETTASGLIKIDQHGHIVEGSGPQGAYWEPTAFFIHSRIHQAIPRAACVMHTHMPHATALSALADMRLLPIHQSAMRFIRRTAYLDSYGGLVMDDAEATAITTALADKDIVLMANHGVTVIGPSIAHCLYDLHYFEIAARDQCLSRTLAAPLRHITPPVIEHTAAQMVEEREYAARPHLAAMLRRLDRLNPGYAS